MENFEKSFRGKKRMRTTQRRVYIVSGVIEVTVGLFGLFNLDPSDNLFWLSFALLIVGTSYCILGLKGELLLPEHNYIVIGDDGIELKNGHQKPKTLPIDKIEDVILKKYKAEINVGRHGRFIYDFSVFKEAEKKEIVEALGKLKASIDKLNKT